MESPAADDEVVGHIGYVAPASRYCKNGKATPANVAALCRRLFATMQAGALATADPSALAASLQLDNSIQQVDCCFNDSLRKQGGMKL